MNITFACPECEHTSRIAVERDTIAACPGCTWRQANQREVSGDEPLSECPVCGCKELFIPKNFSQRIGVAVVGAGSHVECCRVGLLYVVYGLRHPVRRRAAGFVPVLHGRQSTAMLSGAMPSIAVCLIWMTTQRSVSKHMKNTASRPFDSPRPPAVQSKGA